MLVSPSGRQVTLPLPAGDGLHAAVVARRDLDAALVGLARRRGVDVREQCAVEKVAPRDDDVELLLGDGDRLRAASRDRRRRSLVAPFAARSSPTHRAISASGTRCASTSPTSTTPRLWVLFERDLLPGYAWVFPLPGGGANVGYGVLRADGRSGRDLKQLWPELLDRPVAARASSAPGAHPTEPVRAWPIPTRYDPARLANGRVLFVGDAAGVVDPMTGEGIAQALETGVLAAEAVAAGGDRRRGGRALPPARARRSDATCASRPRCSRCCAHPSAPAARSRPPASRPGPAATSPAGCSRTIRGRSMLDARPLAPRRVLGTGRVPDAMMSGHAARPRAHEGERTMASGKAEASIARSPDDVWKVVRDFGGRRRLHAGHRLVHRRRRRPHGRDDGHRDEGAAARPRRRHPPHHLQRRRVTDGQPGLARATISVDAEGDGTHLTWTVEVEPDDLLALFQGAYEGARARSRRSSRAEPTLPRAPLGDGPPPFVLDETTRDRSPQAEYADASRRCSTTACSRARWRWASKTRVSSGSTCSMCSMRSTARG